MYIFIYIFFSSGHMRYYHQIMSSKTKRSRSLGSSKNNSPAKQKPRRSNRKTPPTTPPASSIEESQPQPGTSSQGTVDESPFFTPNPYHVLKNDTEAMEAAPTPKDPKPPPIFVRNIKNFSLLCTQINNIIGSGKYSCLSRTNDTKILPDTPDTYRRIVKYLTETKADYHTYQLKQDRAIRVVIRRLHPTTPADALEEELIGLGFKVRQITNVLKENREHPGASNKIPMPLFFVDLEPTPGVEKIYDITRLYYTNVKVEKPYPKKDIAQCHNCQEYGHTKSYCHHLPRCVKCGQQHRSDECRKSRESPAVCALCHKDHPANYKGCQTYKHLKQMLHPTRHQNEETRTPRRSLPSKLVDASVSFSQMLGGNELGATLQQHPQPQSHPQSQMQHSSPPNHSTQQHIQYTPPPPNATDLTSLLTSFLSEFKSLVTPLISLLTNLVSNFIPSFKNP